MNRSVLHVLSVIRLLLWRKRKTNDSLEMRAYMYRHLVNEASTNKAQSTAYGGQRVDGIGVNLMGPLLPIFIIRVFYLMMVNCPNLF